IEIGEFGDAHEGIAPGGDRVLALGADLRDPALDHAALKCDSDATSSLELLEQRPGAAAEFADELLAPAGAGGWIKHLGEVTFLGQNELRIAGDAARERVSKSARSRKG